MKKVAGATLLTLKTRHLAFLGRVEMPHRHNGPERHAAWPAGGEMPRHLPPGLTI